MDRRGFIGGAAASAMLAGRAQAAALGFRVLAAGLDHAEGVASCHDGRLFISGAAGALGILTPDGALRWMGEAIAPNGVAIDPQGRAIVANMGLLKGVAGGLQRVDPASGRVETLVEALEGRRLAASNNPAVTRSGVIYCTHTSWGPAQNIGNTSAQGFIYRVMPDGSASIVARDLRGPNGLCLDRGERHLYAALTPAGRILRWPLLPDGSLGAAEPYGPPLGRVVPDHMIADIRALPTAQRADLGYCDGIAFDAAGNLWVTLPFANKLVAITPDGRLKLMAYDPEGTMIAMPTNLCWANLSGAGRAPRDLVVVSRGSGRIITTRTRVAGLPMANWPKG